MKIAVILTCHNRCQKTDACLGSLLRAQNSSLHTDIDLSVFLTDDGCTDGTADLVSKKYGDALKITIVLGDGNLYWAGGMRKAWNVALSANEKFDYFLLINDDTTLFPKTFDELFAAEEYCIKKYHVEGLYSGITCLPTNSQIVSYGGHVLKNRFSFITKKLDAIGKVQECDMANANILMVHTSVVEKIGIFYEGYQHAEADYDYSIVAKRNGFPVVVTANICGECDYDHSSRQDYLKELCSMTLSKRKEFFAHPLHSSDDYVTFIKRTAPYRTPMVLLGRWINLYFPQVYLLLSKLRGA